MQRGDHAAAAEAKTEASKFFATLPGVFKATRSQHLVDAADWLAQAMWSLGLENLWSVYPAEAARSYRRQRGWCTTCDRKASQGAEGR